MSVDHRNCTRIDVDEFFKCRRDPSFKKWSRSLTEVLVYPRGGGDITYERGGDASRKFWIEALKDTDLGVAQAFFDP